MPHNYYIILNNLCKGGHYMINSKKNKMIQITISKDVNSALDDIIHEAKKKDLLITKSQIIESALLTYFELSQIKYNKTQEDKKNEC